MGPSPRNPRGSARRRSIVSRQPFGSGSRWLARCEAAFRVPSRRSASSKSTLQVRSREVVAFGANPKGPFEAYQCLRDRPSGSPRRPRVTSRHTQGGTSKVTRSGGAPPRGHTATLSTVSTSRGGGAKRFFSSKWSCPTPFASALVIASATPGVRFSEKVVSKVTRRAGADASNALTPPPAPSPSTAPSRAARSASPPAARG